MERSSCKVGRGFLVFPGKYTCFPICLFLVCSLPTKHKSQGVTHRKRNEGPSHNLLICLDGREWKTVGTHMRTQRGLRQRSRIRPFSLFFPTLPFAFPKPRSRVSVLEALLRLGETRLFYRRSSIIIRAKREAGADEQSSMLPLSFSSLSFLFVLIFFFVLTRKCDEQGSPKKWTSASKGEKMTQSVR